MKLFEWRTGRQSKTGNEYHRWCFLYWKFFNIWIDGYILKYEPNTTLAIHKDPVKDGRHYRINIKLKGKASFWCPSSIFRFGNKVILFRPDLFYHALTIYSKTYKISLGLAIFSKIK